MNQNNKRQLGLLAHLISDNTYHAKEDLSKVVEEVCIQSRNGDISITLCTWGATITRIHVKKVGEVTCLVPDWMNDNIYYCGRTCGRLAGRVSPYTVHNSSLHSHASPLHGGQVGFSHRVWDLLWTDSASACFFLASVHLDQGHLGSLHMFMTVSVTESSEVKIAFRAVLDPTSPCSAFVNPTSHCYFHTFASPTYLRLPTGQEVMPEHFSTQPVDVTELDGFDFRKERCLDSLGLDHCFLVNPPSLSGMKEEARVAEFTTLRYTMIVTSTFPSLVIYTCPSLGGTCFETQYPPNSPHMDGYSKHVLLTKEHELNETTTYRFLPRC